MAEIITSEDGEIVVQVKVKLQGSLLEMEDSIQQAVNDVGTLATCEWLSKSAEKWRTSSHELIHNLIL